MTWVVAIAAHAMSLRDVGSGHCRYATSLHDDQNIAVAIAAHTISLHDVVLVAIAAMHVATTCTVAFAAS